jgi:hypothetical protein
MKNTEAISQVSASMKKPLLIKEWWLYENRGDKTPIELFCVFCSEIGLTALNRVALLLLKDRHSVAVPAT